MLSLPKVQKCRPAQKFFLVLLTCCFFVLFDWIFSRWKKLALNVFGWEILQEELKMLEITKNDAGALENFQHFEHPSLGTKSEQHTHKVQAQLHSVKQEILI